MTEECVEWKEKAAIAQLLASAVAPTGESKMDGNSQVDTQLEAMKSNVQEATERYDMQRMNLYDH